MADELVIGIPRDGRTIQFIYDDELVDLLSEGRPNVRRASHVEPIGAIVEVAGKNILVTRWQADMSPVGGPLLTGFNTRQEALDAEVDWLKQNLF